MHSPDKLSLKLRKKGWSEEELAHANLVFSEHKLHHHVFHPFYDAIVHWLLLFLIIIANYGALYFLLPFMLIGNIAYIATASLAIVLGFMYDAAIKELTHLEKHHHFFIGFIMPAFSVASFLATVYIIRTTSFVILYVKPLDIGIIFAILVGMPYYVRTILEATFLKS